MLAVIRNSPSNHQRIFKANCLGNLHRLLQLSNAVLTTSSGSIPLGFYLPLNILGLHREFTLSVFQHFNEGLSGCLVDKALGPVHSLAWVMTLNNDGIAIWLIFV
ncbi:hypothetical protein D3C81_801250 [compost metagenome]